MSIANQDQRFEWIQNRLKRERYYSDIAWRENENKLFDARDILAFMAAVSPFWTPIDSDHYPMGAYSRKWAVLERFLDHEEDFRPLEGILPEILELYDRIRFEARDHWNTGTGDRRFGRLRIAQSRKRGKFVFPFIGATSPDYQMRHSAALPMLGAFRRMVVLGAGSDLAEWDGGFENVLDVWRTSAAEMIAIARDTSSTITNMTALGRTRSYWAQLDAVVQKSNLAAENRRLQKQIEELTRTRQ